MQCLFVVIWIFIVRFSIQHPCHRAAICSRVGSAITADHVHWTLIRQPQSVRHPSVTTACWCTAEQWPCWRRVVFQCSYRSLQAVCRNRNPAPLQLSLGQICAQMLISKKIWLPANCWEPLVYFKTPPDGFEPSTDCLEGSGSWRSKPLQWLEFRGW